MNLGERHMLSPSCFLCGLEDLNFTVQLQLVYFLHYTIRFYWIVLDPDYKVEAYFKEMYEDMPLRPTGMKENKAG